MDDDLCVHWPVSRENQTLRLWRGFRVKSLRVHAASKINVRGLSM